MNTTLTRFKELDEAEKLLTEVESWTEKEVEELPKFYRDKAKEYRREG